MAIYEELKRRNVFRVVIAYLAAAWLLIQVCETLFPIFGLSDTWLRIIVILLIIGFPIFVIFSWLYELTPEGLKSEKDVDRSRSITHHTGKRLDRIIIVILVLALGYFAVDKFLLDPVRDAEIIASARLEGRSAALDQDNQSIAVLPFEDLSPNADQEYFSDGLSEELINVVTRTSTLRVISRSSAFAFKGESLDIPTIAERLNVSYVLDGSVRTDNDKVRITVRLIDAGVDKYLWTENYDRDFADIFLVQDEIAGAVAERLNATLLGAAPQVLEKTDPEAYTLVLRARHLLQQGSLESLQEAHSMFEEALEIDPDYAPAWVALSGTLANLTEAGQLSEPAGYDQAEDAAKRAIELNPRSAKGHSRLAWIARWRDSDPASAASHYETALTLNPEDVHILAEAAQLLGDLGRIDELVSAYEYVTSRDPLNPRAHYNLGVFYYLANRLPEAQASFSKALTLSPNFIGAHHHLGLVQLAAGDSDAALKSFLLEPDEEWNVKGRALAYSELGQTADADAALSELKEKWGDRWPTEVAQVYAYRNEVDLAFEWLANETRESSGWGESRLNPLYANLHQDPRWTKLLERVGKSEEQLSEIKFSVSIPD